MKKELNDWLSRPPGLSRLDTGGARCPGAQQDSRSSCSPVGAAAVPVSDGLPLGIWRGLCVPQWTRLTILCGRANLSGSRVRWQFTESKWRRCRGLTRGAVR
jgi:hypothetical protein